MLNVEVHKRRQRNAPTPSAQNVFLKETCVKGTLLNIDYGSKDYNMEGFLTLDVYPSVEGGMQQQRRVDEAKERARQNAKNAKSMGRASALAVAKAKKAIAPPPATQRQLEVERKRKLEEQLARRDKMELALQARGEEQVELELEDIEWLVSTDMRHPIPLLSTYHSPPYRLAHPHPIILFARTNRKQGMTGLEKRYVANLRALMEYPCALGCVLHGCRRTTMPATKLCGISNTTMATRRISTKTK